MATHDRRPSVLAGYILVAAPALFCGAPDPWDIARVWPTALAGVLVWMELEPRLAGEGPDDLSPRELLLPGGALVLAAAAGVPALAAAAWVWGLWRLIEPRLFESDRGSAAALMGLLWMALPWESPAGGAFSTLMRESGAHAAAAFCSLLGLDSLAHGTRLVVRGSPVGIEPAYAGLGTMKTFLMIGLWRARGSGSRGLAVSAAVAAAVGWSCDSLRLTAVAAASAWAGPRLVFGAAHAWMGAAVAAPCLVALALSGPEAE